MPNKKFYYSMSQFMADATQDDFFENVLNNNSEEDCDDVDMDNLQYTRDWDAIANVTVGAEE